MRPPSLLLFFLAACTQGSTPQASSGVAVTTAGTGPGPADGSSSGEQSSTSGSATTGTATSGAGADPNSGAGGLSSAAVDYVAACTKQCDAAYTVADHQGTCSDSVKANHTSCIDGCSKVTGYCTFTSPPAGSVACPLYSIECAGWPTLADWPADCGRYCSRLGDDAVYPISCPSGAAAACSAFCAKAQGPCAGVGGSVDPKTGCAVYPSTCRGPYNPAQTGPVGP